MSNFKYDRLAKQILEELTNIINYEISDARVREIVITEVKLTPDMQDVKIYYSPNNQKDIPLIKSGLKSATPFIKKQLAQKIKMRKVPNLIFEVDNSSLNASRIDEILNKLN